MQNPDEVLQDAQYLKSFLARSATQLTDYGIHHLNELLTEGSYSVFFRNDHFSTIHKNNDRLYTLVTDLGFKDRPDIVWQSLTSVKGSNDGFYTSEFVATTLERPESSQVLPSGSRELPPTTDEQLARILQDEEDAAGMRNLSSRERRKLAKEAKKEAKSKDKKAEKRKRRKKCTIL